MTATDSFRAALRAAGLDYAGPILADGKLHRFKAEGDKARNSWFILHAGPPAAGAFGCWRRGFSEVWCGRQGDVSKAEWSEIRRRWRDAEAARERSESALQDKARRTAAWILERATAPDGNAYTASKGVQSHGELRQWRGALLVPLRDTDGALHSLQFVGPDGAKRFLTGGRVAGCFFTVADKADGALVIAEGYATAASVHEATGFATVAAMNAGNLKAVAEALRAKWPERELIVAADNDAHTSTGNVGVGKATEAAKAVRARLAVPQFADATTKATDFNDLATLEGLPAVKQQVESATAPQETDTETFDRLAKLSLADYDRVRESEAERLGIRAGTLDREVATRRPKTKDATTQGGAVDLPDVEPWPDPVDGAETLSDVAEVFHKYVALPSGAADALALWTAHAHAFECFVHSPRLNFFSPEKGCGKTTALDVLGALVPRPLRTESLTAAVLFRLVEAYKPTLLLDEVDTYLSDAEELRGLLNAGHKRGARAYRCEGESNTVRGFNAFAPAALAGIGALPGTLYDRSVVIRLVRAKPGEVGARFDSRRTAHETELCRKLARWTADNREQLEGADPGLPGSAFNRLADNWRPMFAIADAAGADWPDRAGAAFNALTATADLDAQGVGALLLADVSAVFAAAGVDRLPSAKLAELLAGIEGRPWAEFGKHRKPISANQLANQLRRFGVTPDTIRVGDSDTPKDTARGYHLSQFAEPFERFLPQHPLPYRNNETTIANTGDSALSRPKQAESVFHPEKRENANAGTPCFTVSPCKPVEAELLVL